MTHSKTYPNIDMIQTSLQLKKYIEDVGKSVKIFIGITPIA